MLHTRQAVVDGNDDAHCGRSLCDPLCPWRGQLKNQQDVANIRTVCEQCMTAVDQVPASAANLRCELVHREIREALDR